MPYGYVNFDFGERVNVRCWIIWHIQREASACLLVLLRWAHARASERGTSIREGLTFSFLRTFYASIHMKLICIILYFLSSALNQYEQSAEIFAFSYSQGYSPNIEVGSKSFSKIEDENTAVEVVNNVLDRSEKVVNDTKDFISWQITKIFLWILAIVIIGGIIMVAIKIASTPNRPRRRRTYRR